ncbi:DUF5686 and carboxypeptidase-like regulatory domain-containing protein [Urechidicola croceus]|uniref:Carboxypeptidase-like regulatory domain-containing protein n=1 Tax=Urechidicola croceus TaxID=1850246 RepID=A0A1D8PA38_9FLAO|nr:DUF5686 and carboxypeptidase-like regulatory domain-containing protein [Urechidicola croceus]AOW21459.1 hypothetical protein LPB138_12560 [Urechidicola croceus]
MKKLVFLFILIPFLSFSQFQISGVLIDTVTQEKLPFATIITGNNQGTITNIDGEFTISSEEEIKEIRISYIGYKTKVISIDQNTTFLKIELTQNIESLNTVIISNGENPALKIIRNAIKNKKINNIEQSLNSFKFKAYNKLLVTANPDSIVGTIDTIYKLSNGIKEVHKIDSSNYEFKKQIDRSHLYLSEKISEHTFEKGKNKKETVLASRMAGFKQPIYEVLAITIQDFSFYNETYTVAGTKYVNPIADNALKNYEYQILDTIQNSIGKSYMIYFKPKKKEEFIGLEGVLYIDDTSYAITSAISELRGILDVKATQTFDYLESEKSWFPTETQITLKKGENKENMSLFGVLQVSSSEQKRDSTIIRPDRKNPSEFIYFSSKTKHFDIEINTPVNVKKSANVIEVHDNAYDRTEKYWNTYRTDSITKRGKETYIVIDSIIEKEGVEDKIIKGRSLLKGYYATKYINLDLGKIISLNNYEGLRVGFGGVTNTNFSKKIRIESYVAYGTKDKDFKYSLGGAVRLNRNTNTWFGANYTNDIKEAAGLDFIAENNSFFAMNPRNLNISKFYNYRTSNIYLEHDIQPNLETKIQLSTGKYEPKFDYQFISIDKILTNYNLTTATIGLQYNPKNEYMNSPIGKTRIKNEFPQFTLQLTKSFDNILEGDFDFTQLNFRIDHQIKKLRGSTTSFLIEGGIVFGDAPISHLYNATPNQSFKNPWLKRVTFGGKNSFETMGYNEFISDKYTMLEVKHKFKRLKINTKFNPQFSLVTRFGLGDIENRTNHNGFNFKIMNKGYLESGLELNQLYKGLGLSGFYRYGAYGNTEWSDNLAIKLTYRLSLGF